MASVGALTRVAGRGSDVGRLCGVATKFPNLSLEDKGVLEEGGSFEAPIRQSARIQAQNTNMAIVEQMEPGGSTNGSVDVINRP